MANEELIVLKGVNALGLALLDSIKALEAEVRSLKIELNAVKQIAVTIKRKRNARTNLSQETPLPRIKTPKPEEAAHEQ
jgi:hypothetical protein